MGNDTVLERMSLPGFLQKIVDWLRAGYPEGVPATDYVPLFSVLLRTHLTEDDVSAFARELAALSDEDTARVISEALAPRGWPPAAGASWPRRTGAGTGPLASYSVRDQVWLFM